MSVTVEKIDVLSFVITGAERLDPVRVMIENYEPSKGIDWPPESPDNQYHLNK